MLMTVYDLHNKMSISEDNCLLYITFHHQEGLKLRAKNSTCAGLSPSPAFLYNSRMAAWPPFSGETPATPRAVTPAPSKS